MAKSITNVELPSFLAGCEVRSITRPVIGPRPVGHRPTSRLDLVAALKNTASGEQAAFEKLYAATVAKLYGVILRIVGRRDVAEDILQEAYIRVWLHAGEFDPATSSPITWLVAIARNRALDQAKRKTMRSLDDCPEVVLLAGEDDPRVDCERSDEWLRLQACLDGLEPEKRKHLLMAYYYGMTREEIARATDQPVGTVKTWLRRSLRQLRKCLSESQNL